MKTIDYWNRQKRLLMRDLHRARLREEPKAIATFGKAVNKCDQKIGAVAAMRRIVGIVLLLVMLSGGCCTMKGALEDTSWILRTTAENIQPEK